MRPIEYRGWDTREKRWIDLTNPALSFVLDPENKGKYFLIELMQDGTRKIHRHVILTQYTGLFDDRGEEIAEGDVVYAFKTNSQLEGRYVVVWDKRHGRWAYRSGNIIEKYQVGKSGNTHCVINGNVFEDIEFHYILKK